MRFMRKSVFLGVAALIFSAVTIGAQEPVARLVSDQHPADDRTFRVKLRQGIDAKSMPIGAEFPVDGEVSYHEERCEARLSVTRMTKNVVKIKVLWFAVGGHYYYPNASLRSIYVDGQPVGMPVKDPEGLDRVAMVPLHKLNVGQVAGGPALNADLVKINPQGQQMVLLEQTTLSQAYQTVVSVWNLGATAFRKATGKPKPLPAARTELAFAFLGIDGYPDVSVKRPQTLTAQETK